jgi:hypothetical protein
MLLPPTPHEEMVLLQMTNLARRCEVATNPEDIYDRFDKAIELYRDLHPKPQTDSEKAIEREWMQHADHCMRGNGFESVAYKMMPNYRQRPYGPVSAFGLNWGNVSNDGPSAILTHPFSGEEVCGVAPTLALALLAAILRAHNEWHDFWQTGYYENEKEALDA